MRDDEPAPLPQPAPGGRDVTAQGANFFVGELNWPLGARLVREPLQRRRRGSRRELAALHEPAALRGRRRAHALELLADARLVYMVRDPIDRMLSHYLHNVGGGYDDRSLAEAFADPESAYVTRSRYFFQLEPYLEEFGPERIEIVGREELKRDRPAHDAPRVRVPRRRPRFQLGAVRARVGDRHGQGPAAASASWTGRCGSPACERSTATSTACPSRCAGWSSGWSTTPTPARRRSRRSRRARAAARGLFRDDVARLERVAGREFGWLESAGLPGTCT